MRSETLKKWNLGAGLNIFTAIFFTKLKGYLNMYESKQYVHGTGSTGCLSQLRSLGPGILKSA